MAAGHFVADADPATTTDPRDDDSDDDGLLDGSEDATADGATTLGETRPDAADTDGDGLGDGLERGLAAPEGDDTDLALFAPDADPATTTDPLDADTDDGSVFDGVEDANGNGRVDAGERDPNDPADDVPADDRRVWLEGGGCAGGPSGGAGLAGVAALLLGLALARRRAARG